MKLWPNNAYYAEEGYYLEFNVDFSFNIECDFDIFAYIYRLYLGILINLL